MDGLAVPDPSGILVPMEVWHFRGIRERGVTGPYPDEPMPFYHWESSHRRAGIDCFLRRHKRAPPMGIVNDAMVAADHLVTIQATFGQGQEPVPARIFERRYTPVALAIHYDVLASDGAGK
jgi:hypothetical protein